MSPGARELVVRLVKLWLLLGCLESCYTSCPGRQETDQQSRTSSPPTKVTPLTSVSMSKPTECNKASCFVLYDTKKTWIDAFKHCQEKNSSLVQINSKQMQKSVSEFLKKRTKSGQPDPVWIGLERSIYGCGPWFWISGEELEVHTEGMDSHLKNHQKNFCGAITRVPNSGAYKLKDCYCWTEMAFICQSLNKSCCH